jgi:hypothetical protein
MWNYYGQLIEDENFADPMTGWRNGFFILNASGK